MPIGEKLRDVDIRRALHQHFIAAHRDDDSRIIDELGLCQGAARVDVAVINGSLHGFEIKSDYDSLVRLTGQQEVYSRALDSVTVATTERHFDGVLKCIPDWWGIILAKQNDSAASPSLCVVRSANHNPLLDSFAVAQLLWRDEALEILREHGAELGVLTKRRQAIWQRLVETLTADELRSAVRQQLKTREGWRVDQSPPGGGVWSLLFSRSSHCLGHLFRRRSQQCTCLPS